MYIRVIFLCLVFKLICGLSSTGDDIEKRLIDRYNDLKMECVDKNNNKKPAFQCSGLLTRSVGDVGVSGSEQTYAWSKQDSNILRNVFSVAFLRRDQQFKVLPFDYESGFIYYPQLKTPTNKYAYRAYCAFPMNGWTDIRDGEQGCGQYLSDTSGVSASCEAQKINTLTKWTEHYKNLIQKGIPVETNQCSFDLTTKNAAKNFALSIEAKKYLRHASRKYSLEHNEIVLKAWNPDYAEKLPIEAFYYILDSPNGRAEAFQYQNDYLKLTNETIPVVGIRLPTDKDADLHVKYDEKE